jgi:hypothetical protein
MVGKSQVPILLQAMLAEFARQIDEEKKAKEREIHAKAAAYQQMLKENAKELERKKAIKDVERQENQRLFELQIEMAEKQVGWRVGGRAFGCCPLRYFGRTFDTLWADMKRTIGQERMRAQREEERQMRLKKAERMAGEMGSKAAEMEAEVNERVKKAQEQYRCATVKFVGWRGVWR